MSPTSQPLLYLHSTNPGGDTAETTSNSPTTYLCSPSRQKLERALYYRSQLWQLRVLDERCSQNATKSNPIISPKIKKSTQMKVFMVALPEIQRHDESLSQHNFVPLQSQLEHINILECLHLTREMCRLVTQHFHEKYRLHCRICPEAFGFVSVDESSSGARDKGPMAKLRRKRPKSSIKRPHILMDTSSFDSTKSSIGSSALLSHSSQLTFTGHMLCDVRRVSPQRPCSKMQRVELLHKSLSSELVSEISRYMAPEMMREGAFIDRRSDIYSLGRVFYWMLTQNAPSTEKLDSPAQFAHELNPGVPLVLSHLVHKMIQPNPEDRYQTLAGVVRDIEFISSHHPNPQPDYPLAKRDVDGIFEWIHSDQPIGMQDELSQVEESLVQFITQPSTCASQRILVDAQDGLGKSHFLSHLINTSGIKSSKTDVKCVYFSTTFDPLYQSPFNSLVDSIRQTLKSIFEYDSRGMKQGIMDDFRESHSCENALEPLLELVPEISQFFHQQQTESEKDLTPFFSASRSLVTSRLHHAIAVLFGILTKSDRKVVFIMEDLHFADEDSLRMMNMLLSLLQNCFFLMSVAGGDKLPLTPSPTLRISLSSTLTEYDVCQLLARILRRPSTETSDLATFLHQKTGGNFLFLRELVCWMQLKKWIHYDLEHYRWNFDLGKIRALSIAPSLTQMLRSQLEQKSLQTRQVLLAAAYIGNVVRIKKLCHVLGKSFNDVYLLLDEAVQENWIQENEYALKFDHSISRMLCVSENSHTTSKDSENSAHEIAKKEILHRLVVFTQKSIPQSPVHVMMQIFFAHNRHEMEDRHALIRMSLIAARQSYEAGFLYWAFRFASMARNATVLSDWTKEYTLAYESMLWWCRCLSFARVTWNGLPSNSSGTEGKNVSPKKERPKSAASTNISFRAKARSSGRPASSSSSRQPTASVYRSSPSHNDNSSECTNPPQPPLTPEQILAFTTNKLNELQSKLPPHDYARRLNVLKDLVAIQCEHHAFDDAYDVIVNFLSNPEHRHLVEPILNDTTSSEDDMHQWLGRAINSVSRLVESRFIQGGNVQLERITDESIQNLLGMIANGMPAFFHSAKAKKLVFSQVVMLFAHITLSKGHCPWTMIGLSVYTIIHFTFTKEFTVSHLLSEYCVSLAGEYGNRQGTRYTREAAVAWYIRSMWPLEDSALEQKSMYERALDLCLNSYADTWVNYCALYYLSSCLFCGKFDDDFFSNLNRIEIFAEEHSEHQMHAQLKFYCENIRGFLSSVSDSVDNVQQVDAQSPWPLSHLSHPTASQPFHRYTVRFLAALYYHFQGDTEEAFKFMEAARVYLSDVIPFNFFFWHPFWEVLICSDMLDHVAAHSKTRFKENTHLLPALKEKLRTLGQQMDIYHNHFKFLFRIPCELVGAEMGRHHVNTFDHLGRKRASERQIIDQYTEAMQHASSPKEGGSPLIQALCSLRLSNYLRSIAFKPQFVALQAAETMQLFECMGCERLCYRLREKYHEYLKQEPRSMEGLSLMEHLLKVDQLEVSQIDSPGSPVLNGHFDQSSMNDTFVVENTAAGTTSERIRTTRGDHWKEDSLSQLIQNTQSGRQTTFAPKKPLFNLNGTTEASVVSIRVDCLLNMDSPHTSSSIVFKLSQKLLDAISPPVAQHHGFVHDITPEGVVVAVFPNHIIQAVLACLEIRERLFEVMWQVDESIGRQVGGEGREQHEDSNARPFYHPGIAIDYGKIMIGTLCLNPPTHPSNFACGLPFTQSAALSRLSSKLQIPIICTEEICRQLQTLHATRIGCQLICKVGYFSSGLSDQLRPTTHSSVEIFEIFNPNKVKTISELDEIQKLFCKGLFLKCLKFIEHAMRYFPSNRILMFYRNACSLYNEYELPAKWNGEVKLSNEGMLEPISFIKRRPGQENEQDLRAEVVRLRREVYHLKHGEGKRFKGNKYHVVWDESEKRWLREEVQLSADELWKGVTEAEENGE